MGWSRTGRCTRVRRRSGSPAQPERPAPLPRPPRGAAGAGSRRPTSGDGPLYGVTQVDRTAATRTRGALFRSASRSPVLHVPSRPPPAVGRADRSACRFGSARSARSTSRASCPPALDQREAPMTSGHHDHLVASLRTAAQDLAQRRSVRDLEQTLEQIVASAVATVPAVDAGSISITEHGRIETRHPTSESIRKLDEKQSELDEGPCITAIEDPPETGTVVAQDLARCRRRPLATVRPLRRRSRLPGIDVDPALGRRRRPRRPEPLLGRTRRLRRGSADAGRTVRHPGLHVALRREHRRPTCSARSTAATSSARPRGCCGSASRSTTRAPSRCWSSPPRRPT